MLCSLIGFSLQRESEKERQRGRERESVREREIKRERERERERERASKGSRNRREGAYSIPRNTQANKSISYFLSLLSFFHWIPGRQEGRREEQRGGGGVEGRGVRRGWRRCAGVKE